MRFLTSKKPDLIIGPASNPQTLRWHIFKWRGWQLALHKWCRSDDDRALHDHSADNLSLILTRGYYEIVREYWSDYAFAPNDLKRRRGWQQDGEGRWYKDRRYWRKPWRLYFRRGSIPHRIELGDSRPVWSLWLRWPPTREWYFHCPKGMRHWKDYTSTRDYSKPGSVSEVGRGCD